MEISYNGFFISAFSIYLFISKMYFASARNVSVITRLQYRADFNREDVCPEHNGDPKKCRGNGCYFICGDGRCTKDNECDIQSNELGNCQDRCKDLCWCKKYGNCEYDPGSGGCRPGAEQRPCYVGQFDEGECRRPFAYYSNGGVLCRNIEPSGNCTIAETITAINFGRKGFTSSSGIKYQDDNKDSYADHNNIRKVRQSIQPIEGIQKEDKPLYDCFLYGDPDKANSQWCVSYWVELTEDGEYELVVKVAEDQEDKIGQRKFTILFGEVAVFPEIDLLYLVGKRYHSADLIVNFEVSDGGKILWMRGHKEVEIDQVDHRVWLSFCYSTCADTPNKNFLAAGFEVNRFGEGQTPSKFCFAPKPEACTGSQFLKNGNEFCARKGHYYSFGGKLCHNLEERGSCDIAETVKGVNFGGPKATDSRGINYLEDGPEHFADHYGIRQTRMHKTGIQQLKQEDKLMYKTFLQSDPNKVDSRWCVSYHVALTEDGKYELAVRLGDDQEGEVGKRKFTILFGERVVFPEIDIRALAPGRFKAVNLAINFEVNTNATYLVMEGFPDVKIDKKDPRVWLAFCYSTCDVPNRNFLAAAFSVVRLGPKPPVETFCNRFPPTTCNSSIFQNNACGRPGTIYSYGGYFCKNTQSRGNCFIDDTIKAVNFGRKGYWGNYDIFYEKDTKDNFADHNKIRFVRDTDNLVVAANQRDKDLFTCMVIGKKEHQNSNWCLSYHITICEDGKYELGLRVADPDNKEVGVRKFNILFGERAVFPEVDVNQLGGNDPKVKHRGVDLSINFEVVEGGTKIKLPGFEDIIVNKRDKRVWLAFCYGTCDTKDKTFAVGAFSVVRFGAPPTDDVVCSKHQGNACACRYTGHCEYDIPREKCIGKSRICSYTCQETKECRRFHSKYNSHIFYADGGVVCQNKEQRGNCMRSKTIMAVNFNGPDHVDIWGISYKSDKGIPYDDPYKTRRVNPSKLPMQGVPKQDLTLYDHFIWGLHNVSRQAKSSCVTYYIPLEGDGNYELSIKTGEIHYTKVKIRNFNYMFNGQTIVAEFEPGLYRMPPYGFDLNVNFKVTNGGKSIQMKGHPVKPVSGKGGKVPLSFCFGNCQGKWGGWVDVNWQVGAFSVIKFMR